MDWAIIGTGVTEYDIQTYNTLKQQDYLSTLVIQDNKQSTISVLGVMTDFINPLDTDKIIETLSQPVYSYCVFNCNRRGVLSKCGQHI